MLFFYNGNSKLSGIYEIRNRHSNRSYIGQAKEFKERWVSHKCALLGKFCNNKFFQNDFNKCFEKLNHTDFLEFHVIEVLNNSTKDTRNEREEWWIQEYKNYDYILYNSKEKVGAKERKTWSNNPDETRQKLSVLSKGRHMSEATKEKMRQLAIGRKHTEETKRKLSIKRTGEVHKPMSELTKEKIRQRRLGSKIGPLSLEHKKKLSDFFVGRFLGTKSVLAKTYDNLCLQSPTGEIIIKIECLNEFCRKNGLEARSMCKLLKGKQKSHRGWKLI